MPVVPGVVTHYNVSPNFFFSSNHSGGGVFHWSVKSGSAKGIFLFFKSKYLSRIIPCGGGNPSLQSRHNSNTALTNSSPLSKS